MKTRTIFFAVLATVLAACSSSDDENSEPASVHHVNKENIVGVWRNGDYFVSFSEEGFMSAYLSNTAIAEGDYTIDGDTIVAESSAFSSTKFVVNSISSNTLNCTVTSYDLGGVRDNTRPALLTEVLSLTLSDASPCVKENVLVGKSFSYDTEVRYTDKWGRQIFSGPGVTTIKVYDHCVIDKTFYNEEGVEIGWTYAYYVYLSPYIYYFEIDESHNYYNKSDDIINIKKLILDNEGNITVGDN